MLLWSAFLQYHCAIFQYFVKLIALNLHCQPRQYMIWQNLQHSNHTLLSLKQHCKFTAGVHVDDISDDYGAENAYRHSRHHVPCSFITTVGLWLELNFIKFY